MTREEAREAIKEAYGNSEYTDEIIKALDQEPTTKNETLVSFGAYKQVAWERDVAIEQLHELGYEFGQKIESTTKNDLGVDAAVVPFLDTISRQEAIDTIRQLYLDLASQKAVIDILKVLPSVTPQESRWIPISERLPENCGMYIVTRKIYDCPDTAPIFMSDESWFDGQNTWHNDNRINHERGYLSDVIAWMPLPKEYREDKE